MAILELDYFEYATHEAAQLAYVTSGSKALPSGDLVDEICTNLDDWTDTSVRSGSVIVDPAGQYKFDSGDTSAANNDYAGIMQDFGSLPNTFTFEIKIKHDALGARGDSDHFEIRCRQADEQFRVYLATDGIFIQDTDDGIQEVGTNLVKSNGSAEWQIWRFLVTYGAVGDGVCDVYLKDSTHDWTKEGTAVTCSDEGVRVDGELYLYQLGFATNNLIAHIDYIKIDSGLTVPSFNLQCYSEDTIIQQGSYSLKVVAQQTDSLNDTLTKSGLSIDLSGRDELKIDFYALRTGTNIQVQMHDSGGTTSTKDIAISSSNEWETKTWDISGISDANKDDIDSIIIKIINADDDNTFYVDNFYSPEPVTEELYDINNDFRNAILELKDIDNKFNSVIESLKNINNDFRSVYPFIEIDYMEYATDETAQLAYVTAGGTSSYTKLLLHCEGIDAVPTFIDEAGKTVTANGNAQLDTAQKKFGTASGLFDGTGDYLTAIASADWNFDADFTIDFWYRKTSTPNTTIIKSVSNEDWDLATTNDWLLAIGSDNRLSFYIKNVGVAGAIGTVLSQDTWYHIAIIRSETTTKIYLNGTVDGNTLSSSATFGNTQVLNIGAVQTNLTVSDISAHLDELKIDKGIANWTSDFIPLTVAYFNLQCYSEDTILEQGSYSLKIVADQTDSINEILTRTLGSGEQKDLSDRNGLKLYVRANRTGTNIQARLYDSVGGWFTKDINVPSTGTFIEIIWDISGIADVNKSNITKIEFKILNADSDTIYYVDYFYASELTSLELYDIDNDFRLRKEELLNIINDFRTAFGGLFSINNDFRSVKEVITDIKNKFRTLRGVIKDFDNKFNFALRVLSDINVKFAFALGALIDFNNDVRTHKLVIYNVNNNFRMIRSYQVPDPPEVGIQALGKSYFTVKINGVDKTSILDLDSLSWKETLNSSTTASFVLGIPYDSVSSPSENQTVEILFNNHRKFYGYITNIAKVSDPEGIRVSAEDEYWNLNKTEVDFKVGRELSGDPDTYYTTIQSALSALGFGVSIGNFIPVTMSLVGSKADVISRLIQESGNFQWFIKPDGAKKLWQADSGDIINLEEQVIGTNLGLYQVINHNIVKDSSGIVNKFKVIMGDDIVPGYNNEFRFAYVFQKYWQYDANWIEFYRDGEPYSKIQRKYVSSIQWYDRRRNVDTDAYEAYVEIAEIGGDEFRITVPSGMIKGYPLKYKAVYDIGVSWQYDYFSENTFVNYSHGVFYDRGGIYPEARRERNFEVTMGSYPQTITKDLVLSNLNVQYGTNYRVWEGHNWSSSYEYNNKINEEYAYYTSNSTGAYITQKSFKIDSWNDIAYATDYANWQLSKNCDIKENGTIAITMDCAYFYGLDLSKRINISGITDKALNIVSISYDVRNYLVTINVESARSYARTVSIPVHLREE